MGNKCPRCAHETAGTYPNGDYLVCEDGSCSYKWIVGSKNITYGPDGKAWNPDLPRIVDTSGLVIPDKQTSGSVSVFTKPSDPAVSSSTVDLKAVGVKHDGDKPALQFVPQSAMWAMGLAFGYGAKKYGNWNFKNGLAVCRCLAAAIRHIYQFLGGENLDPESGHSHLGHAMASIAMAIDMHENRPDLDDRPKK